jgi:hypothetical protein
MNINDFDNKNTQILISLCLGLLLGIIYQRISPKTIIINGNNSEIIDLENKSFGDKCYRYKKVETSCD